MATGYIPLNIGSAIPPDGSTDNIPPGIARVKSSASAPSPHWLEAQFDAAIDESLDFSLQIPGNYASGLTLHIPWKMTSATTGNVVFQAYVSAVSDGDSVNVNAKGFGTVNTSSAIAVPGTARHMKITSLALTNADNLAAGDWIVLRVGRDADNAGDTAVGDLEMLDLMLSYTVA